MNFGDAIEALERGKRVCRAGWNGKGMWLVGVGADSYLVLNGVPPDYNLLPFIGMKTADNCFVSWLASQTDMHAKDWELYMP